MKVPEDEMDEAEGIAYIHEHWDHAREHFDLPEDYARVASHLTSMAETYPGATLESLELTIKGGILLLVDYLTSHDLSVLCEESLPLTMLACGAMSSSFILTDDDHVEDRCRVMCHLMSCIAGCSTMPPADPMVVINRMYNQLVPDNRLRTLLDEVDWTIIDDTGETGFEHFANTLAANDDMVEWPDMPSTTLH
jgi:hypothetical protein